jgi:long-chain-fatty-acid---luciferin-component ligase
MIANYLDLMNQTMQDQSLFYIEEKELREQQNLMLENCFQYHYDNCEDYRKFCEGRGVNPSNIKTLEDIAKIPLLDSFKTLRKRQFLSIPKNEVVSQFCSTGSSGKPLLWISLDQVTMDWMIRASALFNKTMIEFKPGATLLMLPYIPQLKFAVVSKAILKHLDQKSYFGLRAVFGKDPLPRIEPDTKAIEAFIEDPAPVKNLIGFPFTITQLKEYLEAHNLPLALGKDGMIVTGGGWKPRQKNSPYASMTRDQIEGIISQSLSVPVENIRDAYGCTEILLGYIECKNHRYHVPPWCYHAAVDPEGLTILENGKKGLGACFDFAVHSYPGFILTEDFIRVHGEPCPCGITGQTIEYLGRLQDDDPRGCSFKFEDKLFSEAYLEGSSTTPDVQTMNGLMDYLMKNKQAISGDFLKGHVDLIRKALDTITETISVKKVEMPLAREVETLQFVALGKLMCYKQGKPTLLAEDAIIEQMPELKLEVIKGILEIFEGRKFVKKIVKENRIFYKFTKKADEFGEAFYPLLMWGIKYTK